MYKAAKQFQMKARLSVGTGTWWPATPTTPLDCREDDYAWCNSSPDGQLIPAVHFERLREGLDDYRRMLTLSRLAKEQAATPAARDAQDLLDEVLGALELGQRKLTGWRSYGELRGKLDAAIDRLR